MRQTVLEILRVAQMFPLVAARAATMNASLKKSAPNTKLRKYAQPISSWSLSVCLRVALCQISRQDTAGDFLKVDESVDLTFFRVPYTKYLKTEA